MIILYHDVDGDYIDISGNDKKDGDFKSNVV